MKELPKVYEPHAVEDHWIQKWIDKNLFSPDRSNKSNRTYSVVIPPPNVTGVLHMGHALTNTIQDILVRWRRMHGDNALWLCILVIMRPSMIGFIMFSIFLASLSFSTLKIRIIFL